MWLYSAMSPGCCEMLPLSNHKNRYMCMHLLDKQFGAVNYSARYRRGTWRYQLLFALQCFQSKRNTMSKTQRTEKLGTPN